MGWKVSCLCVFLISLVSVANGQTATAYFDMAGVKGSIDFSPIGLNATNAIVNLTGVDGWSEWEIREFPIMTTASFDCSDAVLGSSLYSLTSAGSIGSLAGGSSINIEGIPMLKGDHPILGRSILLKNGSERACATIQGDEPVSFAILNGHIAGNIQARKVGTRFVLFAELFRTTSLTSLSATLAIHSGTVSFDMAEVEPQVVAVADRCSLLSSESDVIASYNNVPVEGGGSIARWMTVLYIDAAVFDFSSGSVLIGEGDDISCANFHKYEPKTVVAMFSRDKVKGAITFTQDNPYQPTRVTVDLQNLNEQAGGYHVHVYPLPYQYSKESDLCGPSSTGGHFNPFSAGSSGISQDQFEVGDLSGKHGSLASKTSINKTFTDLYLPLFGEYSIVGRSVVIHTPSGSRWICANIGYHGAIIVAKAEFNGDAEGTITFVQEENKPWGDTTIFVQMTDSGDVKEATTSHKYHIHASGVGDDHMAVDGRCSSTGGHWNPFDVPVKDSNIYGPTCAANKLGCEVGDMNGKFKEKLNIAVSPPSSKYFYNDVVPLSGAYSVIRRSVTIHQKDSASARYVCADIMKKLTPAVTTDGQWDGVSSDNAITGAIKISSSGLPSHTSKLNINLSGLQQKAGGYHIHNYPLNMQNRGSNVCGTTGGHYNPLGASQWESNDSFDNYEVGDLSNKFSMLTGLESHQKQADDPNLPLSGAYSVVGRSVVVHDATSRWKCTNTIWDMESTNGTLLQARAAFSGEIEGHVTFKQVVSLEGQSDVNVQVMLWYSGDKEVTIDHKWHVHVSTIHNGGCGSAGGHYNPFNIDTAAADYGTTCGSTSPRKCEVGDMSGKLSKLSIGTKDAPTRYVFNDDFLSLTGKFGVMGRSIVIHAASAGGSRVACADIVPIGEMTQTVEYRILTPSGPFKDDMADKIAVSLNADDIHNVYVNNGAVRGNCTTVEVYFTGENAVQLKDSFNAENLEDEYKDSKECGAGIDEQNEIQAYFNMSGVMGNIEFRELGNNETRALINLDLERGYKWEIREFPILTTGGHSCDDEVLGKTIHDLTSYKDVLDNTLKVRERVDLIGVSLTRGDNAILGRSILLRNGSFRACATIHGPEPLSFAILNGHIAGNVQVRKVGTRYAVFTDLFNTRSLTASELRMKIYRGAVKVDLSGAERVQTNILDVVSKRCDNEVTATDMVKEIEIVPVSGGGSSSRFMTHVDLVDAPFDFTDGWFKIGEDLDASCANFHRYQPKVVQAWFSRDGAKGAITFSQDNPYRPTQVHVSLTGLEDKAGGYHVHAYPLPYQYTTETNLCGSSSTGGHFNPFGGQVTDQFGNPLKYQDEMEIGDLSTKHGSLKDKEDIDETYTDLYLPLFGDHSIVGRSVVIHAPSGSRWICANIGYPGAVIVAKAEFNGDAEGTITFVQEESKPWGDTSIFVQLTDSGDVNEATLGHKYHIHTKRVGVDHMAEEGRCSSTGPHWDPYDAALKVVDPTLYKPTCAAHRQGCEAGDLNGKYNETIDFASTPSISKYFYTDVIALSGAYSVIRRSVTIHQQNSAAARYVCADIIRKLSPVAMTTDRWNGKERINSVSGGIRMYSSGLDTHATRLEVDLQGLINAGGYHVHNYPLNTKTPGSNVCGTTGGHYNPFAKSEWDDDDSLDRYEIGDLSNKFGKLTDKSEYKLETMDTNLPLSGAYSVVGRSVVIHDDKGRWKCTNTVWDPEAMNGTLLQARADFNGDIEGHITLSQVVSMEGDSDVNVEVMLWYKDENRAETVDHNWHVHVASVYNGECSTAKGHYNPFDKVVGSENYEQCTSQSPRKCELGDMSKKLGKIAIGTKKSPTRYVFTDNFLSLTGKFAVMGRSIVIHFENSGGPRIACADLAPFGPATQVLEYYIKTPSGPFKDRMAASVATQVDINESQNIYVQANNERGGCTAIAVYFTGHNAKETKRRFHSDQLDDDSFKPIDVDTCSALGSAAVSGVLLLASLLISFLH